MKYIYAIIFLLGFGSQLYSGERTDDSAQAMDIAMAKRTLALASFVKSTAKPPTFRAMWKKQFRSTKSYLVERLCPSEAVAAIASDDGTVTVLDSKTGKCLLSLVSSDPTQKIVHTKSILGDRVVLARENGLLEVVTIDLLGDSSSIELPSGSNSVRGMAFGKVQGKPRLVVAGMGRNHGCIAEFNIDTWKRKETGIDYCPDSVTTLQDGTIKFTEYFDSMLRRNIATYKGKDNVEWMDDLPRLGQPSSLGPLYLSPYGMIGSSFAAFEYENLDGWSQEKKRWLTPSKTVVRVYNNKNTMPLDIETGAGFGVERFIAEGRGTIVTALNQQLKVRNQDGVVGQTLLDGDCYGITGFAYEQADSRDHIFAAVKKLRHHKMETEITAWCADRDDVIDDSGE